MSPPASVTITQLEPVVFLRGLSSSGEDARGRRRPVNIDAPPSQLRGLVTVYLPKPSKIKEISISLKGTARTDWPEGIGPNRVEMMEEMTIFHQTVSLYNAKQDKATFAGTRRRSNSVGPGIGLQEDVDWEYAAATATARPAAKSNARSASSSCAIQNSGSKGKDDERPKSSGGGNGGGSNLARQIAGAAAKAGTAMIPPTLRPDMGLNKSKDSSSSRSRPPLQRTGSGTTSWTQYANSPPDSTATTPAQSPPAQFHNPWSRVGSGASSAGSTSLANTPRTSFFDQRGPPVTPHQDLSRWNEYFKSQGHERPPLYAPRSAPLQGYDSWPTEIPPNSPSEEATSPNNSALSSAGPSTANTPMDRTAANSTDAAGSSQPKPNGVPVSSSTAAPGRSILHTQPPTTPRPKEQTVRFDPQSRVDNAANSSTNINGVSPKPNGTKSAPSSRRSSIEIPDNKNGSKGKSSSKNSSDLKVKKPGLKTLINGLLKEPAAEHKSHPDDAHSTDSKEFKKGTYTYPICISLPSNLPPTLHADFGFNRYILRASVVRSGPLTPNLVSEREVNLIHASDEDALEETDSIVVERCWEDLLSYMVVFSGKSFPIGQKIPLWLKFVPLGKVKIHRILATLEEKTDYYAKGRRVARHEVPRKWTLMKIAHKDANEPILPILSDKADALDNSPLAPLARAAAGDGEDQGEEALPSILDPTGPWELATELMIPASGSTRINLSTNHSKSNIAVHHLIRLSIRVGRSDWEVWNERSGVGSSSSGKPQLYDIIIEAPITLTSSHTATEWTALPNYWSLPAEPTDQDLESNNPNEVDTPLRPALPSPVLTSRTGMVGQSSKAINGRSTTPTPLRSPTGNGGSSSPPMSRNPTQLSRRWLALSADHINRDGNNNAGGERGSGGGAPPPAYQENARSGERTVASTSMSRSPSEANGPNNNVSSSNGGGGGGGGSATAMAH